MKPTIRIKLSLMMFLQFFVWGSWFVTLGTYLQKNLNTTGGESAAVFSTQSWGALIAPFIIGLIADRYFNAERILGILHLFGSLLMFFMFQCTNFNSFYPLVLIYMVLFMPTLGLINSVAFRQMRDPERDFSKIRFWGSLGWIIAGLTISYVFFWDEEMAMANGSLRNTFLLSAISSLILGLFSFTLPRTPPNKVQGLDRDIKSLMGLDAISMLKDKNYFVFFVSAILICIPLSFYYQNAHPFLSAMGMHAPTGKMALGQVSEAICLLLIPIFFKRFGFKVTILVGMIAWTVRYLLFAFGDDGGSGFMLITGILLHGICYDFFFVSGQIYTNATAHESHRSSAQGLITLATYGIGMLIGFWVAGRITDVFQTETGSPNWYMLWIIPACIATAVFLLFMLTFKQQAKDRQILVR